jgi:DNA gyrase/topoisomerase IV subunit A
MISSTGYASRFSCAQIRTSGRISGGIFGIKTGDRKNADGGHVVGMIATSNHETHILTISRNGMGKRSRLGTSDKIPDLDREGVQKFDKEGKLKFMTDGYRRTKPGAKGVRTMTLDKESKDAIVSVRQVPDLSDNLFLLTGKGMMIRVVAGQTKGTLGRSSKGTRIMELRDKVKGGFHDQIIFSARLPAALLDEELVEKSSSEEE